MNMSELVSRPRAPGERSIFRPESAGEKRRRRHPDRVGLFREGLRVYDVRAVCMHRAARYHEPLVEILRDEGFALKSEFEGLGYEIWIRQ
jgi:hypothetical protein